MCGIIAVLRRKSARTPPATDRLLASVAAAEAALHELEVDAIEGAAAKLAELNRDLAGTPGLWCLLADRATAEVVETRLTALQQRVHDHERALDEAGASGDLTERHNA
ncbi:MAG: hypothetical protein KDE27_33150, partial [Planctomycetes bacterium]|nr:hypothetical protein [Planctomycetota bacterium]